MVAGGSEPASVTVASADFSGTKFASKLVDDDSYYTVKDDSVYYRNPNASETGDLIELGFNKYGYVTSYSTVGSLKGSDFSCVYSNTPTEKKKFLRLYDEYNKVYQDAKTQYTKDNIKTFERETTGQTPGTYNTNKITYSGSKETRSTTIYGTAVSGGGSASARIDTNDTDINDTLSTLKDNTDESLHVEYKFNSDGSIYYSNGDEPYDEIEIIKVNKYGYLEEYSFINDEGGTIAFNIGNPGEPQLKTIPVSYDETSMASIGMSLESGGKTLKEDGTVDFAIRNNGSEEISFYILAKVNDVEVYKSSEIKLGKDVGYYSISSNQIKNFSELTEDNTIVISVEKAKAEGVSLQYVNKEDYYGKLIFSSGLPESIEFTAKSLEVTFTYTRKNKGSCRLYICENASDPSGTKVTQSYDLDESQTTYTFNLSGIDLTKYTTLYITGVFGS